MTVACPLCTATFTRSRDLLRHTANRCPLRNSYNNQIIKESKMNIIAPINKKITVKLKDRQNLSTIKAKDTSLIQIPETANVEIAPPSELNKLTNAVIKMMEKLEQLEKKIEEKSTIVIKNHNNTLLRI